MLGGESIGLVPKESLTGWQPLLAALLGLAFASDAVDHWHSFGIIKCL